MYLEEKLERIENELKNVTQFMMMLMPDLRVKKDVIHFLKITRQTFTRYVEDGVIKEGVHYYYEDEEMIFIPEEIIKLKAFGVRKKPSETKAKEISNVLEGMGIQL